MQEDDPLMELHAIVYGEVQGVGFRATTRYLAQELRVTGTVRNQADGSVEIYLQGTRQQIESLLKRLQREIGEENISRIQKEYRLPQERYIRFEIIF